LEVRFSAATAGRLRLHSCLEKILKTSTKRDHQPLPPPTKSKECSITQVKIGEFGFTKPPWLEECITFIPTNDPKGPPITTDIASSHHGMVAAV
jgi:hypothetical protein